MATKFVFVVKGRDAVLKIYYNDGGMCVAFLWKLTPEEI
jgi:hypothetical protein